MHHCQVILNSQAKPRQCEEESSLSPLPLEEYDVDNAVQVQQLVSFFIL